MIKPSQVRLSSVGEQESHKLDRIAPYRYVRLSRLLIPSGMGPLSWLSFKPLQTKASQVRLSPVGDHESNKIDGISPYKYVRLTRLLISSGMDPVNWL